MKSTVVLPALFFFFASVTVFAQEEVNINTAFHFPDPNFRITAEPIRSVRRIDAGCLLGTLLMGDYLIFLTVSLR